MSVQKRSWKDKGGKTQVAWRVRWQEGDTWRSKTFSSKADANNYDNEVKRRQRLGTVAHLEAGTQTLDQFVRDIFVPTYMAQLAPKTQEDYGGLYDHHLSPDLGWIQLRQLNPESIRRWQATRLRDGAGPTAVDKTLTLLGSILQRAVEGEHIQANPVRAVKHAKLPRRAETVPLPPSAVESVRAMMLDPAPTSVAHSESGKRKRRSYAGPAPGTDHSRHRDATLISVLGYAGLRPQEALALKWSDINDRTIRVYAPKTHSTRTVRLLTPLATDLKAFKMLCGRPAADKLIFPDENGDIWPKATWDNWRERNYKRALAAAGVIYRRPYALRHSFASLLLHEGRNVIYVARQLGHGAQLTLSTYGHVIEELEGAPQMEAEAAIQAARLGSAAHQLPMTGN